MIVCKALERCLVKNKIHNNSNSCTPHNVSYDCCIAYSEFDWGSRYELWDTEINIRITRLWEEPGNGGQKELLGN